MYQHNGFEKRHLRSFRINAIIPFGDSAWFTWISLSAAQGYNSITYAFSLVRAVARLKSNAEGVAGRFTLKSRISRMLQITFLSDYKIFRLDDEPSKWRISQITSPSDSEPLRWRTQRMRGYMRGSLSEKFFTQEDRFVTCSLSEVWFADLKGSLHSGFQGNGWRSDNPFWAVIDPYPSQSSSLHPPSVNWWTVINWWCLNFRAKVMHSDFPESILRLLFEFDPIRVNQNPN